MRIPKGESRKTETEKITEIIINKNFLIWLKLLIYSVTLMDFKWDKLRDWQSCVW